MPEADRYEDYDEFEDEDDDGLILGPDERDRDLLDGSWEQEYYSTDRPSRDWNTIGVGIALLLLMGMILPTLLFALR